ncbi:hypothetical protein M2163_000371 [Streptomyces sp. SAI-135]|nr:hypothetical protein [Streptomyces sp. SAI-090]MDH6554735.1 hypothetical protein [Streptomyces sp. SAI-041]MDH6574007.1 hypothetical protein [Streptomyces sp. SAI-117]MDH6581257.1 hypothetical protein [Streptomyces sp. SAI-133]MDH6613263.1 hypothetical protein [Streptomyces sp. SAI-135]
MWVADRGFTSATNRRALMRGGGDHIIGEKLRTGSPEVRAALSRQGRYATVRDNLQVKEVNIGTDEQLTKRVLESALEGEITDHVGYDKHDAGGRNSGNSLNGTCSKTVLTDVGPVEVKVPRDTAGTFEPQLVKKRQRRLTGVDEMVLSLSAKGLTHGEISAHLAEVYGAEVSKQTISTITDSVMKGMAEWQARPLDRVYPVVFVEAINVKIRDGKVANRPIYVAIAVTVEGTRDILGIWAGDGGEGAKHWLQVFTELKNRDIENVLMLVCDGLKGLPDAVETVWPRTAVQTCIVHLIRNSIRYSPARTGTRSPRTASPSTPRRARPPRPNGSWSSRRHGQQVSGRDQAVVRRLGRDGALPNLSTSRSARSSAARTGLGA